MASPGDKLQNVFTSSFYNQVMAFMGRGSVITGSGGVNVANTKNGLQISAPPARGAISTLQGTIVGGAAPACTDGTTVLDIFAWNPYSVQGGAFITAAGTTVISVQVNAVAISWLDAITVDSTGVVIPIPDPLPDLTHVIPVGAQLTIVTSSSSGDCTGLQFNLNVPF